MVELKDCKKMKQHLCCLVVDVANFSGCMVTSTSHFFVVGVREGKSRMGTYKNLLT